MEINSKFGLFERDFINVDAPQIEIIESEYKEHGVIISKYNPYFDIVNCFAKHFNCVSANNDKTFILSNSELMKFALIPFK